MRRIDRKRLEALSKVADLSKVLSRDLKIASDRLVEQVLISEIRLIAREVSSIRTLSFRR